MTAAPSALIRRHAVLRHLLAYHQAGADSVVSIDMWKSLTHHCDLPTYRLTLRQLRSEGLLRNVGCWSIALTDAGIAAAEALPPGATAIIVPIRRRPCLRCRETMVSEGPHHRICDRCKRSDAWRDGAGATYSMVPRGARA